MNRRWYDEHEETQETLELLKRLDNRTMRSLSRDLSVIVKQIKELREESKKGDDEDEEISLGLQRVLGLYQSENARRWYDKNVTVSHAMEYIKRAPFELRHELALDIIEYIEQNSEDKK